MEKSLSSSYFQCQICHTFFLTTLNLKEHQKFHRNPLREEEKPFFRKVQIPFCSVLLARFDEVDVGEVKLKLVVDVDQKPLIKSTESEDNEDREFKSDKILSKSNSKEIRIRTRPANFVQGYTFSCQLCPGWFPCKKFLDSHVTNVHNGWRSLMPCCICGRVFNKRDSLNAHHLCHLAAEAKEEKYKLFEPWDRSLNKLKKRNGNQKIDIFRNRVQNCKVCLLPHSTHHSYLQHFLREHSNPLEDFRFKCRSKECKDRTVEFRTVEELSNHCKDKHAYEYYGKMACCKRELPKSTLMCGFCAYPSKDPKDLQEHIEKSHPRRFQCHCSRTFTTEKKLRTHILVGHERKIERKFKCDFCNKAFEQAWRLRSHQMRAHEKNGERKVVECHICKNKFTGISIYAHLKRHDKKEKVLRGEEVVRYQCGLCKRDYATAYSLKKHVETLHFMKRPEKSEKEMDNSILGM